MNEQYNQGDFCGIIYLSKNGKKHKDKYIAMVDMDEYERINSYNWSWHNLGYAYRREAGKNIMMHGEILPVEPGLEADHIDRNKLNNTKANLRPATPTLNSVNKGLNKANTTKYKGVSYRTDRNTYVARLASVYLGSFQTAEEAARVYDKAALKKYGAFAYLDNVQLRG